MIRYIYIAFICIIFILLLTFNNLEAYDYETSFTQNDLKFIPYSSSPYTNALNNYVIRAVKPRDPYLLSSILDSNGSYNTHSVFEFPTNDPRKSIKNHFFDIEKNYKQQFRPIITHNKDREELYKNELIIDQMRINDPYEVNMHPKYIDSKIDYTPRDKNDTLQTLLHDPKLRHTFRPGTQLETYDYDKFGNKFKCPWGFTLNKKKKHKLKHNNYMESVADACELL
tara:strand:- start:131 stop:808 length:678 start_codon:yes stop_codon:yes gene_type:complete